MKSKITRRIATVILTLGLMFGAFRLGVHAENSGWIGSSEVSNTHENLSKVTNYIEDLLDGNKSKDEVIKKVEKMVKEQEKTIREQNKKLEEAKKNEDKIDDLEDQLEQAHDDVKSIEEVTEDMVEEMEK